MTTQTSTEAQTRLANFTSKDIKALVQHQGKTTEGNYEFTLKEPSATDQTLQTVINTPTFEVRSIGAQGTSGEAYYDLKANGKQVRIKISSRKLN